MTEMHVSVKNLGNLINKKAKCKNLSSPGKTKYILNLWVAKKNSHTHTCAHTSTCAMCVRNKVWNVRAMCVRARPLGDLRVAIATSQLCPKYFPFTYLFYQDFKVEMAKVCLITKKIVQFSLHSILYCRSLMQRLVYPWSMIWNTYLNFHDW